MNVHGRPGFAKPSIVDGEKEEIAAIHSDSDAVASGRGVHSIAPGSHQCNIGHGTLQFTLLLQRRFFGNAGGDTRVGS